MDGYREKEKPNGKHKWIQRLKNRRMWAKDIGVFLFFKFSINLRSFSNKMLPPSKKQHVLGHYPPHTHISVYIYFSVFPQYRIGIVQIVVPAEMPLST